MKVSLLCVLVSIFPSQIFAATSGTFYVPNTMGQNKGSLTGMHFSPDSLKLNLNFGGNTCTFAVASVQDGLKYIELFRPTNPGNLSVQCYGEYDANQPTILRATRIGMHFQL